MKHDQFYGTYGSYHSHFLPFGSQNYVERMSTSNQLKFVDPMKTTNTAQYAALAANSSCLRAFVSSDMAAANNSVKTIKTPIAANIHSFVLRVERRYMLKTGAASNRKITVVMMRLTSFATRDGEK
jgi:hypothetical protein